jgi:hypothetical protein
MNCELVCKQKSLKTENPISHNNYLPHSNQTSTVKVRGKIAPKSPSQKKNNIEGKDETLNINISTGKKNITTHNECWDVPVSPFYHFLRGFFIVVLVCQRVFFSLST